MHKDGLMARGTVNLVLRNEQGKVKQHKTVRNKITEQGLAHIVGRMIDSGEDRVGYTGFPTMMKFMGLGTGSTSTIDGITSAAAPAGTNEILERECTVGTVANAAATSGYDDPANPGTPLVTYQTGRVDMSRTANVNADSGGTGHSENKIYQAVENPAAPGVLQEDTGVSPEGSYDNSTGAVETVNSVAQTRKTGDRLVYRAFFGENHPALTGHTNGSGAATSAGSAVSLPITEAGIFNKQAMIKADGTVGGGSNAGLNKDQSMLCRTRFKQVNKAPQDSLQVTWSIKIADQT
jgi:hypothetical protein